jgi:hypothetical protein
MVDLYNEVATFGIIGADISLIISIVIALFLIIIALLMLFKKVKRNAKVNGIITKSNCTEKTYTDNKNTTKYYSCNITVNCTINNKNIDLNFTTSGVKYDINDKVILYYDPLDITDIDLYSDDLRVWGWVVLFIAVFIVVSSAIWSYVVRKSKFAAAIGGGAQGINILGGALGGLFGK